MTRYMLVVGGLNAAVNFLLLVGSNRICGDPPQLKRTVPGALLCGVHAAWCLADGFHFLGNGLWRTVFMLLACYIAYGVEKRSVRVWTVYILLSLIFTGITAAQKSLLSTLFGAVGLFLVCYIGSGGRGGTVPVQLQLGEKSVSVMALRDTGNTLYDPVSGSPVLVLGSDAAGELTGLSDWQLQNPVESMGAIPGLRLIPYRTVNSAGAFMLGMRLKTVQIGKWKGSGVVAFAPQRLCDHGQYQALTGGVL